VDSRRELEAGAEARERRLITLLCGTAARRRALEEEISCLAEEVDDVRPVVDLLKRMRLFGLIGGRMVALGLRDAGTLEHELELFRRHARKWATATELASLEILSRLEAAGIRALPLKGSMLARQIYGDMAARSSMDIDILVAPEDLSDAVAAVAQLGWRWMTDAWRPDGRPLLHETLVHPALPPVELHWRVHWYERRFAADALARAERSAAGEPLQMQPLDGLIALMLFYARDGFTGLRFPADAAAWWDLRCSGSVRPPSVDVVAQHYPELAAPVRAASRLLAELVGIPMPRPTEALPFRWRVAAGLATPFQEGGRQQAEANAALADVLLAPSGAAHEAIRRVLHNAPAHTSRSSGLVPAAWTAVFGHVLRVGRRWLIGIVPAVARSWAPARVSRG
jgi:hypothetical protein